LKIKNKVERANPLDRTQSKKWYPILKTLSQVGDWSSFHLTCNGEGSELKEGIGANSIKNLNIRFVPGKMMKEALQKAVFVCAEDLIIGK
jgi:hypothetical protein